MTDDTCLICSLLDCATSSKNEDIKSIISEGKAKRKEALTFLSVHRISVLSLRRGEGVTEKTVKIRGAITKILGYENLLGNEPHHAGLAAAREKKKKSRYQESLLGAMFNIFDSLKIFLSSVAEQTSLEWKGMCYFRGHQVLLAITLCFV